MKQLVVVVLSLSGFVALALAMPKHARQLGLECSERAQRVLKVAGWGLLVLALAVGIGFWGISSGQVHLLGWLTIVGVLLAWGMSRWEARRQVSTGKASTPKRRRPETEPAEPQRSRGRQVVMALLLVASPAVFAAWMLQYPVNPLLGSDAVRGQIGDWTFTLAEANPDVPKLAAMDVPVKSYQVRFCDGCQLQMRQVYLRLQKPRSMRTVGTQLRGRRTMGAELAFPPTAKADDEFWLTVEGKDGKVYQAQVPLARVSPNTANWFNNREE